jgi:tetratricopeptide (TPR) repeat protein
MSVSWAQKTLISISLLLTVILAGNRLKLLWLANQPLVKLAAIGTGKISESANTETLLRGAQFAAPDPLRISQAMGKLFFFRGEYQAALPWLEQVQLAHPTDQVNGLFLGQTLWKLDQPEQAIRVWQQVNAGAYFVAQGRSLMQREQWREALENVQLGVAIGDVSPETHFEMGKALVANGRIAEAIPELNQALTSARFTTIRDAYYWLGRAYDESDHLDEALQAYRAAYARSSPETYVAYYIGKILYEQQQYTEAETYLIIGTQATDLALGHYMLGRIYALKQDWQNAAQELKRASEKQPENAAFHESLAEVWLRQGNQEAGLQEYQAAYCLSDPSTSIYIHSRQVLQQLAPQLTDCAK